MRYHEIALTESLALGATPEALKAHYMEGNCLFLAVALHRRFKWPLYVLGGYEDENVRDDHHQIGWYHVLVKHPNGMMVDINGPQTAESLEADWPDCELLPLSEQQLIDTCNDYYRKGLRDFKTLAQADKAIDQYLRPTYPDLFTLTEVKRPGTRRDAATVLKRAGYQQLGHGAFASVFHKEGANYVLKVFSAHDRAYLAFISLVLSNPNPHFPKFIGKVVRITPDLCAIRMEMLSPYRYDERLIAFYLNARDFVPSDPNSDTALRLADACEFMEERPDLKTACDLIIDNLLKMPGIERDLRQDNLMMRGRTIVLTDPVKSPESFMASVRTFDRAPAVDQKHPADDPAPEHQGNAQ